MTTKIYGASDDLIEFEGDVRGEVGFYSEGEAALIFCSDGTLLHIKYGKPELAVWSISLLRRGELIEDIEICKDEDAKINSDIAKFKDGLSRAYVATKWERAK